MWTLLQGRRAGRVILLTTHYMQEADILADRKCILSGGRVKCLGSSLFLKARFGIGYYLNIAENEDGCDRSRLSKLIQAHIPTALEVLPRRDDGLDVCTHDLVSRPEMIRIEHLRCDSTTNGGAFHDGMLACYTGADSGRLVACVAASIPTAHLMLRFVTDQQGGRAIVYASHGKRCCVPDPFLRLGCAVGRPRRAKLWRRHDVS